MVCGDVPIEAELIKKLRRFVLPTHHRTISDLLKIKTRESENKPRRNQDFFNGIQEFRDKTAPEAMRGILRCRSPDLKFASVLNLILLNWFFFESEDEFCWGN